ncbi:MAG TPA: beta-ketoacyl synthase N-terminal-like domain-containing protein, partial [Chloroflexota bacterium]|nr:beta-ketoacyl synthase N-terminal-like domain-containing protein [Chloroflexota bacterium]
MTRRRVVVTGIGAITACASGDGRDARGLRRALTEPRSAIRRITRFDPTPFRSRIAAEIDDFDPLDHMDAKRARRLDRFSQLAVAASRQALVDASLPTC